MTLLPMLIVLGLLAFSPRAATACQWFGTRLECDFATSRVVIGTQAAAEPTYARSFPIRSLHGGSGVPDDHVASGLPFAIELQNFGTDPSLCRRIGNETYCY